MKQDELLPHILPLHHSANRQDMSKSWHNVCIVVNNVVINILSWSNYFYENNTGF